MPPALLLLLPAMLLLTGLMFTAFARGFDFSGASLNGVSIVNALSGPPSPFEVGAATVGFPPVPMKDFQFVFFRGVGSNPHEIALDVVTPEPTTLVLWGTGAAGLGVARWVRRRRSMTRSLDPRS